MAESTVKDAQVEVPVKGKTVFGFNQLWNPTPQFATNIFRAVLYTVAVVAVICNIITEIPEDVRNIINHYGIELVALVHGLSRFFGVDASKLDSEVSSKQ